MKKALILILLLLLTAVIFACQPTPETETIVQLGSGKLKKLIESNPLAPYEYEAPVGVQETIDMKACTFYVDAPVEVMETTLHPVYRVQRRTFSEDEAARIYRYFISDAIGIRDASVQTREELLEQILSIEQGVPTLQEDGSIIYMPNEHATDILPDLNNRLKTAPEEHFHDVKGPIFYAVPSSVALLRRDGKKAYCFTDQYSLSVFTNDYGNIQMQSWILHQGGWEGEGPVVLTPSITDDQARVQAASVLADLGINNMSVAWVEKARMLKGLNGYTTVSTGWYVTYVRSEGNYIPFDNSSVSNGLFQTNDDSESFAPSWRQESISIYLDETGVRCFIWRNPCTQPEELNANVALLPFDEICARMEKLLKQGFAWIEGPKTSNFDFTIYRIVLTNCPVREKNDPNSIVLMPTWIFVFKRTVPSDTAPEYLAINALDGSRVQLMR